MYRVVLAFLLLLSTFTYTFREVLTNWAQHSAQVDVVVLGDSHVELVDSLGGSNWGALLNQQSIATLGFSGYTSELLINGQGSPLESTLNLKPKQVILVIGANDVDKHVPIKIFMRNIEIICTALRNADIDVIVHTVPPVTREYDLTIGGGDFQDHAIEFNTELISFCKRKSIKIFDLHALLIDEHASNSVALPESLSTDGIHLNQSGYRIWSNSLRAFLNK